MLRIDSNSLYVIAKAVFPKRSPSFGKEIASYLRGFLKVKNF